MKRRRHLHTDFIRFLLEKYSEDLEAFQDEEIEIPINDEDEEEKKLELIDIDEVGEEENDDEEDEEDEVIIEKLINEYMKLKKQYEARKYISKKSNEAKWITKK